jgi:TadE-like protein
VGEARREGESGDTILEFAAALPLLMLLFFTLGAAVWTFWSQAAADAAAAQAAREAAFNRGGDLVLVSAGASSFSESTAYLTGERTASAVGGAGIAPMEDFRMVVLQVLGGQEIRFGPIQTGYTFNGGAASRLWRFYSGPPDPWE